MMKNILYAPPSPCNDGNAILDLFHLQLNEKVKPWLMWVRFFIKSKVIFSIFHNSSLQKLKSWNPVYFRYLCVNCFCLVKMDPSLFVTERRLFRQSDFNSFYFVHRPKTIARRSVLFANSPSEGWIWTNCWTCPCKFVDYHFCITWSQYELSC